MRREESSPAAFTIRSTTGIFLMEEISQGVYEGSANGYILNICIENTKTGYHFEADIVSDSRGFSASLNGNFQFYSELSTLIPTWIDGQCQEQIDDYESDARKMDTGKGRIAWWTYNTHLGTTPVVFVHGGPGGDSNPVKARRLKLDNPVYLYDQMGCGFSDPIVDLGNWDVSDYVDELKKFIDSIPSEKVILCGASWGGGLSVAYAGATGCHKLAGLILPNPFLSASKWSEDTRENLRDMGGDYLERFEDCVAKKDYGEEFKQICAEFNSRYLFSRKCFREYAVVSAEEVPNEVFRTLCGPNDMVTDGKLKDFDVIGNLDDIDLPVLFVCGDSDEVRVETIISYRNRTEGSRLAIVPHAGHVLALEQFDSYRAAIKAFLEENGF